MRRGGFLIYTPTFGTNSSQRFTSPPHEDNISEMGECRSRSDARHGRHHLATLQLQVDMVLGQ